MNEVVAPVDMFQNFQIILILVLGILGARMVWRIYRLIADDAAWQETVRVAIELATVALFFGWVWYGSQIAFIGGFLCIVLGRALRFRELRWR